MIPAGVLRVLLVTPGVLVVVGVCIAVGQDNDDGTGDIVYIEDMVSELDMSTGMAHSKSGPKPPLRLQSKEPWVECPGGNLIADRSMLEVRDKYRWLLWQQPNVRSLGLGFLKDKLGIETGQRGIIVGVSELPPEDRLPECLEGVPIQVKIDGGFVEA